MFSRIKQLSGVTARLFSSSADAVKHVKPLSMGTDYVTAAKKPGLNVVDSVCVEDVKAGQYADSIAQKRPSVDLIHIEVEENVQASRAPSRRR